MAVDIIRVWTDDHLLCCEVDIHGKKIELWWCGWEGVAAAKYANESNTAMSDLLGVVRQQEEADREDTISCDVCGNPVNDGDICIIPDERTVCPDCHAHYHRDPEKFDKED